jgi:hypothetical protein
MLVPLKRSPSLKILRWSLCKFIAVGAGEFEVVVDVDEKKGKNTQPGLEIRGNYRTVEQSPQHDRDQRRDQEFIHLAMG